MPEWLLAPVKPTSRLQLPCRRQLGDCGRPRVPWRVPRRLDRPATPRPAHGLVHGAVHALLVVQGHCRRPRGQQLDGQLRRSQQPLSMALALDPALAVAELERQVLRQQSARDADTGSGPVPQPPAHLPVRVLRLARRLLEALVVSRLILRQPRCWPPPCRRCPAAATRA